MYGKLAWVEHYCSKSGLKSFQVFKRSQKVCILKQSEILGIHLDWKKGKGKEEKMAQRHGLY